MSCVVSRAHERLVRLVRLVRTLTLSQTRNFSTHRGRVPHNFYVGDHARLLDDASPTDTERSTVIKMVPELHNGVVSRDRAGDGGSKQLYM